MTSLSERIEQLIADEVARQTDTPRDGDAEAMRLLARQVREARAGPE